MNPIKQAVYVTAVKTLGYDKAEKSRAHFKNAFQELSKLVTSLTTAAERKADALEALAATCKQLSKEHSATRIGFVVNEASDVERYATMPPTGVDLRLITFDFMLRAWAKRKDLPIHFADEALLQELDLIVVDDAAVDAEFLNALRACAHFSKTIPILPLDRSKIATRSTQGTFWYGGGVKTYAYFYNYFSSFYQIKDPFQLHIKATGPDGVVHRKTLWIHADCHYRIGGEDFGLPADQARAYSFEYTGYHPRFRVTSNRIRFGFDVLTPTSAASLHSLELISRPKVLHRIFDSTTTAEAPILTFRSRKNEPVRAQVRFHLAKGEVVEASTEIPASPAPVRTLGPRALLEKARPGFQGSYTAEVVLDNAVEQIEVWSNDLTRPGSARIDGNHVISAAKPLAIPEKRLTDADVAAIANDIALVQYVVPLFRRGTATGLEMDSEITFHTQSRADDSDWSAELKLFGPGNVLRAKKVVRQGLLDGPINLNDVFASELRDGDAADCIVLVEPKLAPTVEAIKAYGETNPGFRLIHRTSGDSDSVELQGGFPVNLPGYLSPFPSGYSGRFSNKNRTNIISRLVCNDAYDTHAVIMHRCSAALPDEPQRVKLEVLLSDARSHTLETEIRPNSMLVVSMSELKRRLGSIDSSQDYYWLRVTSACSLTGYSILESRAVGSVGLQHFWGA